MLEEVVMMSEKAGKRHFGIERQERLLWWPWWGRKRKNRTSFYFLLGQSEIRYEK